MSGILSRTCTREESIQIMHPPHPPKQVYMTTNMAYRFSSLSGAKDSHHLILQKSEITPPITPPPIKAPQSLPIPNRERERGGGQTRMAQRTKHRYSSRKTDIVWSNQVQSFRQLKFHHSALCKQTAGQSAAILTSYFDSH